MTPDITDDIKIEEHEGEGAYTEYVVKKFGKPGSEKAYEKRETTDPDTMTTVTEETVTAACRCGHATVEDQNVHWCVACEERACPDCEIRWSRRTLCPWCAEAKWKLQKPVFHALWMVDKEVDAADTLVDMTFQDGEAVEIAVDHRLAILQDLDYIDEDGSLSPEGQEALSVGEELYSDDDDVQALEKKHRILQVANGGQR